MAILEQVTEQDWDEKVKRSYLPVLVCVSADWCGACKRVKPILEQIAEDYKDRARIYLLDSDENKKKARELKVSGLPTTLSFCYGDGPIEKVVGVASSSKFEEMIRSLVLSSPLDREHTASLGWI